MVHIFNPNTWEAEFKVWWSTHLIPALGRQMLANLCEFKDNLVYRVSSRAAKDTQRNAVSKCQKLKIKIKEIEFKIKPCNDGKYKENFDICYCVVFELIDCLRRSNS